ncbi:hypothetical protein, partial [Moorena sp. SIO4G3]|uniref:hypothetical protein n=1 Tax=Moorena sp. SIO4G3 TaxID=2607821 RepID=UPI0025DB2620
MNPQVFYESQLIPARSLLSQHPTIQTLLRPSLNLMIMLRFMIEFSAKAVQITQPVDTWIRRAGERCLELGLNDIGSTLIKHA